MNFDTVGIPLSFVVLVVMALWLIIGARGWWWLKCAFIVLSLYFSFAVFNSVGNLFGWPSDSPLPQTFRIYWAEVKEPNKRNGTPGAVYVWVKEIKIEKDKDDETPDESYEEDSFLEKYLINFSPKSRNEPRLHKLPYSKEAREQINKLKKGIAKGKKFYGKRGKDGGMEGEGDGDGDGDGEGKGDGKGDGQGQGSGSYNYKIPGDIQFYELPPPKLPKKD